MLLRNTERGIFCERGNFYIDPWKPVDNAIITHGHSDHARWGSKNYLTSDAGVTILQQRLGLEAKIEGIAFGETIFRDGVKISFHPAGHILGSAQIRIEYHGEVWVVSGDYKIENDGISGEFQPLRCHTFISESTFALPIYHWQPQDKVFSEINDWWRENQIKERTSVLFSYSLGKAQRVLSGLDASIGPIVVHGAVEKFLPAYREAGANLPVVQRAETGNIESLRGRAFVVAPGSTDNSPWLRKFGDISTAFASGWMQIRGPRRRRALDRGFVLSDHADWDGLLKSIDATGAENIWATHGHTGPLVRWLQERGKNAMAIETRFEGELADEKEGNPEKVENPRGESD
jgi:putative mRNA 3-end processing factor